MITAANTPHTITNGLMICFSSETDIAGGGVRRVKHTRTVYECHNLIALLSQRAMADLIAASKSVLPA
jgi:hypothetical protein